MGKYRIKEIIIGKSSRYIPQKKIFGIFWDNFYHSDPKIKSSYRHPIRTTTFTIGEAKKIIINDGEFLDKKIIIHKYPCVGLTTGKS